jgi:hypothetical protein
LPELYPLLLADPPHLLNIHALQPVYINIKHPKKFL